MKVIHHMSVSIEGLLKHYKRKKINLFEDADGNRINDAEVRAEIARLQALGHKLIPSSDCEGFDPFGGGCPGHQIQDEAESLKITGNEKRKHI